MLIEASSDAVITHDRKGRIVEFNAAAEVLLGHSRDHVVGTELLTLAVPARLRESAAAAFVRITAQARPADRCGRFETVALRSDGSELEVEVAFVPFGGSGDRELLLCVRDATKRLDAQSDATQYRRRVRALMAEKPDEVLDALAAFV